MWRAFMERVDAVEPWAVFWAVIVWLACAWFAWALVRVGASAEGQGRRALHDSYDRRRRINREQVRRSQVYRTVPSQKRTQS